MSAKGSPEGGQGFAYGIKRWALAASAASVAESFTFPLDVTKTRLQLQNELGLRLLPGKPTGMFGTMTGVFKHEGLTALYAGLPAAVIRQAVYGGIGIGMYATVRDIVCGGDAENAPFYKRILSGMITGSIGQLVASPTDVVKVRIQADGRLRLLGEEPRYRGTFDAFRRIPVEEGIGGYFRGLGPSISRAAVINGTGIAVYDQTKRLTNSVLGTTEGLNARVFGAMLSGLASALVSSPFDVIKTRLMNRELGTTMYKGPIDCLVKTVRAEGVLALYKGFTPAYTRLAPWQMVFFLTFEQLNEWFGGDKL